MLYPPGPTSAAMMNRMMANRTCPCRSCTTPTTAMITAKSQRAMVFPSERKASWSTLFLQLRFPVLTQNRGKDSLAFLQNVRLCPKCSDPVGRAGRLGRDGSVDDSLRHVDEEPVLAAGMLAHPGKGLVHVEVGPFGDDALGLL